MYSNEESLEKLKRAERDDDGSANSAGSLPGKRLCECER